MGSREQTCIAEHLILHNNLISIQGFRVHFICSVLTGKVEENLRVVGLERASKEATTYRVSEVKVDLITGGQLLPLAHKHALFATGFLCLFQSL